MGPLHVNYRERISQTAKESHTLTDTVANMEQSIRLDLTVHPSPGPVYFFSVHEIWESLGKYV